MTYFTERNGRIYFGGYPFAKVEGAPWPGLELEAIRALADCWEPDDIVTVEDHVKAIEEAEKTSYDAGHIDGLQAGQELCEEKNREAWEAAAFAKGRRSALLASEKAEQVERVDALLDALAKAHEALHVVLNKRYPAAKVGECKEAMRVAESLLIAARIGYRSA